MLFVNNKNRHYRTVSNTCLAANLAYLIIRIFYLVLFIIAKLYVLVYIAAGTILIYLFCFYLLRKEKYYVYALVCGNEFLAFVIAMTLLTGFHSGFHLYLLGLSVVSFFTSYFSKRKNIKGSVIWVGLSLIIYLVLYLVTSFNTPYYILDKWLEITLFSVHIAIAFSYVVFYLVIFLRYALSLEKKIMNESRTDELTQINNRYALYDFFNQEGEKNMLVLALFDIDNFKKVNDQYGHITGDFILKRVAEITTSVLSDAFVCRYGGEEFVIVMKDESFYERLEALRNSIQNEVFEFEGVEHKITVTIGTAYYQQGLSLEKWVELADEKMYSGKASGKNKTVR